MLDEHQEVHTTTSDEDDTTRRAALPHSPQRQPRRRRWRTTTVGASPRNSSHLSLPATGGALQRSGAAHADYYPTYMTSSAYCSKHSIKFGIA